MHSIRTFSMPSKLVYACAKPICFAPIPKIFPQVLLSTSSNAQWHRTLHWTVFCRQGPHNQLKDAIRLDRMQLAIRANLLQYVHYRNTSIADAKKAIEKSKIDTSLNSAYDIRYGAAYHKKQITYLLLKSISEDLDIDWLIINHIMRSLKQKKAKKGAFYQVAIQFYLAEIAELRRLLDIPYFKLEDFKEKIDPAIYEMVQRMQKCGIQNVQNKKYSDITFDIRRNIFWQTAYLQQINDNIGFHAWLLNRAKEHALLFDAQQIQEIEQDLMNYCSEQLIKQANLDLLLVEFSERLGINLKHAYSLKDLGDIREKLSFPLRW